MIEEGRLADTPQLDVKIGGGAGWRLQTGKMGEIVLSINSLRGNGYVSKHLAVTLRLMSNWGGIGAKNYIGYGVFDLQAETPITDGDVDSFLDLQGETPAETLEPSISRMFFSKITLDLSNTNLTTRIPGIDSREIQRCLDLGFLPTAPLIRYRLRTAFRGRPHPETQVGTVTQGMNPSGRRRQTIEIQPGSEGGPLTVEGDKYRLSLRNGDAVSYRLNRGQIDFRSLFQIDLCSAGCQYCGARESGLSFTLQNTSLPCLSQVFYRDLDRLRHQTIGTVGRNDNQGAKIATSHLYPLDRENGLWQMRIWGYVPEDALPRNRGHVTVTAAQIIAELETRISDAIFWQHCFDDPNLRLCQPIDFRQQHRYTSFREFFTDLVLHPDREVV